MELSRNLINTPVTSDHTLSTEQVCSVAFTLCLPAKSGIIGWEGVDAGT